MFLDDGIGDYTDYNVAVRNSECVKQTMRDFGFLLADEKCNWVPSRRATWLGHLIDMESNMLFISGERIERLQKTLDSVLFQIRNNKYRIIPVKVIVSVAGQIISLQSVVGNKVRLLTRELFNCINSRASWNAPVIVSTGALSELEFWRENASSLNDKGKHFKDAPICLYNIFSDASAAGYWGYIENNSASSINFWDNSHLHEVETSITGSANVPGRVVDPFCWSQAKPLGSDTLLHVRPSEMGKECPEEDVLCCKETLGVSCKQGAVETVLPGSNDSEPPEVGILAHNHSCMFSKVSLRKRALERDEVVTVGSKFREGSEVLGEWSPQEGQKSSTWREAEAVSRIVKTHVNVLKNSVVKVYSDNKNIKSVLLNGSRKSDIHAIATDLNAICEKEGIILSPEWIPREGNEKADYLSRCQDSDDWEINSQIFQYLDSIWGPYTIDRFASHLSKKCKRFNSRWWVRGTEAVDAFLQSWKYDSNWLVPPPRLICRCLE